MKTKTWYLLLVACLCLGLSTPVVATDCSSLKKELQAERDFKRKRTLLDDAILQCPDDPGINYSCGLSFERFRKYEQALGYYQKVIAVDPNMVKAYAGKGDVYVCLGLLDEAIESYQEAVKRMPSNSRYRNRLTGLVIKRKALRGEVITVSEFILLMSHRGKISNSGSLLLTGPALQYQVAFVDGSSFLEGIGGSQLRNIGLAMQNDILKDLRFEILSHAVSSQSSRAAYEISQKRAQVVKHQLVANSHIDPSRLEISWYGDTQPLEINTKSGRISANQRIEFKRLLQ